MIIGSRQGCFAPEPYRTVETRELKFSKTIVLRKGNKMSKADGLIVIAFVKPNRLLLEWYNFMATLGSKPQHLSAPAGLEPSAGRRPTACTKSLTNTLQSL